MYFDSNLNRDVIKEGKSLTQLFELNAGINEQNSC